MRAGTRAQRRRRMESESNLSFVANGPLQALAVHMLQVLVLPMVLCGAQNKCTMHPATGVTNNGDLGKATTQATSEACLALCEAEARCCIGEFVDGNKRCYLKDQGQLVGEGKREGVSSFTCTAPCLPAPPHPGPPPSPPKPPSPTPPPSPPSPPGPYPVQCGNRLARGHTCMQFLNMTTQPVRPGRFPDTCAFNTSTFYAPATVSQTLKKVHVVHTCHFDFGFTNVRWCVVDEYLNQIYPQVLKMMATDPSYIYHTQPFLLFMFFNCEEALQHAVQPPGVNITCPKAALLAQMGDVIRSGRVSWQAYDWDALTEIYGPNLIGLGTRLSKWLDDKFAGPNVTRKKVMSLIDVPGMAASNIPGLADAGVQAVYFGHLSVKVPDGLPGMLFNWKAFNSSVVAMFHPEGYGGIFRKDLIYDPVSKEGLLMAACLENSNPATDVERSEIYDIIAHNLSVARSIVQPSTLEAFFSAVDPATLPVYEGEMGDDWNRAVGGDPKKTALLRAFGRIYTPGSEPPSVARLMVETFALSAGEHNFGVFYRGGGPWTDYSNHVSPLSWEEQRNMINTTAFSILADVDPVASTALQKEVAELIPTLPDTRGMTLRFDATRDGTCSGHTLALQGPPLGNAHWKVALNCSAAVVSLNQTSRAHPDTRIGPRHGNPGWPGAGDVLLASVVNPLAYLVVPGQPTPQINKLWSDPATGSVVASVMTNATRSGPGGLPLYQHWLKLDFTQNTVNVTVWLGKAPDVINGGAANQQAYLLFNPPTAQPNKWVMDEQGIPVPVTFANDCSLKHYHCVWSGMSHPQAGLPAPGVPLEILSSDVPLVAFMSAGGDVANIMHMDLEPDDTPDLTQGMFFNLFNTLNGAWIRQYPWKEEDYWTKYRFAIKL